MAKKKTTKTSKPTKPKVEPLRARIMTLEQLQRETLKLIEKVRKHLAKPQWEGLNDTEFDEQILDPLATKISCDIGYAQILEERKTNPDA